VCWLGLWSVFCCAHMAAATCTAPLAALLAPPLSARAAHQGEGGVVDAGNRGWRWVVPFLFHATLMVLLPALVGYTPFIV
jgi:hypothetical protein